MKSIQVRLIGLLALAMALLSVLAGGTLYAYLRHALLTDFDLALDIRRQTLRSLITVDPTSGYDVDIHTAVESEYYRIVGPDGRIIAQSTGVPEPATMPTNPDVLVDIDGPTGTRYRATMTRFRPFVEDVSEHLTQVRAPTELTLVVARDRRVLDGHLFRVGVSIAATTVLLSLAAIAATIWIIRGGLRMLMRLAAEAASIDVTQADARFVTAGLPTELLPIATRLNDMLERVGDTITRERRFSADAAHELRTPIAELRAAAEIALRAPHDATLGQLAVTQARDIAVQMQTVVSVLLSIVRKDAGIDQLELVSVPLCTHVDAVLARCDALTDRVERAIDTALFVRVEPTLLAAVLCNLIGNALHYGTDGFDKNRPAISIRGTAENGHVFLVIENFQNTLFADDVERMFDPFWRKDAARSDGTHAGLGLTLARSYCRAMKADIAATLPTPDRLRMTLTFCRADVPIAIA